MNTDSLLRIANRNHGLLHKLTEGLTDEQTLVPLVDGGSHLNWVMAHLVTSRDEMLETLGAQRVRTKEVDDTFDYGSTPPTTDTAWPTLKHLTDYDEAHERLVAALEAATDEKLAEPHGKSTVGARLEFALWHETYHVGQVTLYRRVAGLKSPIG